MRLQSRPTGLDPLEDPICTILLYRLRELTPVCDGIIQGPYMNSRASWASERRPPSVDAPNLGCQLVAWDSEFLLLDSQGLSFEQFRLIRIPIGF